MWKSDEPRYARPKVSEEEPLNRLVNEYITQRATQLLQLKKGLTGREQFLKEAGEYVHRYFALTEEKERELMREFEEYVFGYGRLSALIDDPEITDIRVLSYDNVRVKRKGIRSDGGISFRTPAEYRQFVDYIAVKNQVSLSNLNAIQRFTDVESHPEFILRFTVSMPLVNSYSEPYLCIRKVPKHFPLVGDLIRAGMMSKEVAEELVERFRSGSTLICGGNSSGKTTLLNALKETLPDNVAILVVQQADELTTMYHPDMMFLHSLPQTSESKVSYDLKQISIAGLTMDVDYFLIGEVKGNEALYLLNAACTGQICSATIHSTYAARAVDKLVDYAMYESRYSRNELMRMMDCFQTVILMKEYKVREIHYCRGWDEEKKELRYERVY